jgi:hypothetical protein
MNNTQSEFQREPINLGRGALLRIRGGKGTLVYVWEGQVWLTEDGSPSDHVIGPGQWFRLGKDGTAYAQAFQPSVLSLTVTPKWGQSKFSLSQFLTNVFAKFALTPFRKMG